MGKNYQDVRLDVGGWLQQNPEFEFENNAKISDFLEGTEWYDFQLSVCHCNLCFHYKKYCVLSILYFSLPC